MQNINYKTIVKKILITTISFGMMASSFFLKPNLTNADTLENKINRNVKIEVSTFLGNEERNFYGKNAPDKLDVLWKIPLGGGKTIVSSKKGVETWYGSGWTGQPLIVEENGIDYLIQGAYDHNLKKINSQNGEIVWQYKFDDIIKGTGTIWENKNARTLEESIIIIQGSRLGNNNSLASKVVPSLRAISYFTGEELWRFNVKKTDSYSRDVDGSGLIIDDLLYIGLENGTFCVIDPNPAKAEMKDGILQPKLIDEELLYEKTDISKHGGNLVMESSVCRIENHVYMASGSGHVYGYNLDTKSIDWKFDIGSDIDGSAIVTEDNCLLVSVEKQYIPGKGGIFKLNPSKNPEDCVEWYFPTENRKFSSWEGGIIGSCSINENSSFTDKKIAAFTAIDGNLYVVDYMNINSEKKVLGPDNKTEYGVPILFFKQNIGGAISTPIIVDNKLIVAGYGGIYLFQFDENMNFIQLDHKPGSFESTPSLMNDKIYVGCRDGYMYCFGEK